MAGRPCWIEKVCTQHTLLSSLASRWPGGGTRWAPGGAHHDGDDHHDQNDDAGVADELQVAQVAQEDKAGHGHDADDHEPAARAVDEVARRVGVDEEDAARAGLAHLHSFMGVLRRQQDQGPRTAW